MIPSQAAKQQGIDMTFFTHDSATVLFPEAVDLLFIDTLHVYGHVKRELACHHANGVCVPVCLSACLFVRACVRAS